MAKKTAADLDMSPLAVAERHHATCQVKVERIWKELDKMFDKTGDHLRKGVTMVQFEDKLRENERAVNELFHASDNLVYQTKHKDDPPTEPQVPEEDVRAIINASLDDKTDELQFNQNRGLLASAIARAIRMDVTEDVLDAPLCEDHR